jgi:hypothetical protein
MVFILTNYLQQLRGYSALSDGLAFLPMGLVILVVSVFLSARLVNRFGVKPIIIFWGWLCRQLAIYCFHQSHRKLLWWIARTNAPHRGWICVRLHCNQHSCTHRNYERRTRPRLRINQHFSSNRRRNRSCGAVDGCEFQNPAFNSL